jgi:glycerate dehydrogenase
MNIVVLDGYTLNPGDLSWDGFESLGNLTIHDRTPAGEVVSRAQDAEIVMVNKVELTRDVIQQLPKLKYIGELATGFNNIDLEAARERDIPVTNIPTYGTTSVAQMVFAHLLELTQHVGHHDKTVREGRWTECPDFSYWDFPMIELNGLTLGLIGLGRIGQATAKLGQAFGMNVIAYDMADVNCPGVD